MVVCYFSRRREFRADAGSAQFAGKEKMISALQALKSRYEAVDDSHPSLATLKISGRKGFLALLSTIRKSVIVLSNSSQSMFMKNLQFI